MSEMIEQRSSGLRSGAIVEIEIGLKREMKTTDGSKTHELTNRWRSDFAIDLQMGEMRTIYWSKAHE